MASEITVRFEGAHGTQLAGVLHRPAGRARAYALFAHCFTCSKEIRAARRVSGGLVERGFAVLRFDFTGLGESVGDFAETTFTSNVADLVHASEFLRREYAAPAVMVGHSLGGAAVLAAAHAVPETLAVATLGAPAEPLHVQHLIDGAEGATAARDDAEFVIAGRPFHVKKAFIEDIAAWDLATTIRRLGKALLVLHAPLDGVVALDNARQIYVAAKHPKSFVALDGADHLLSRPRDARYAADVISAWASRYLPDDEAVSAGTQPGEVRVSGGPVGYTQEIHAGPHQLIADEPRGVGGDDLGPSPYDLVLAGLGACTSMTLRMYADRKGWPLEGVDVQLAHRKVHADDCADCDTKHGKIDEIARTIRLAGPLDDAQRQRLMDISTRCPVHRTLTGEIKIRDTLAETT